MADRWMIRGVEYGNCNCDSGCPCQFNSPTTNGFCEAVGARSGWTRATSTTRGSTGCASSGCCSGRARSPRATGAADRSSTSARIRRSAKRCGKILHGESTAPGATAFFVFNSTMSQVLDPIYAPIELRSTSQRAARGARAGPGRVRGSPIINPHTGDEHRRRSACRTASSTPSRRWANGRRARARPSSSTLDGTHGQFHELHMNQDGVIR